MATKKTSPRIKKYIAKCGDRSQLIEFYPFQAESINATLHEDGLDLVDAEKLISKWNCYNTATLYELSK